MKPLMSTRCNILVKDGGQELWFYRHSDGYPESVLPSLQPLIDKVNDGTLRGNIVQFSGWIIAQGIEEYHGMSEKYPEMFGWKVGAYEPTTGQHGDIEHLYTIELGKKPNSFQTTATLKHEPVHW